MTVTIIMKAADILSRLEPFKDLSKKELSKIAGTFHIENFNAGEEFMQYRDIICKIGLIEHGDVILMIPVPGKHMRMSGKLSQGDFIVDAGILTNGRSTCKFFCETRLQCYIQPKTDYLAMVNSYPAVKDYFYRKMIKQLTHAVEALYDGGDESLKPLDEKPDADLFPRSVKKAMVYMENNFTSGIKLDEIADINGMSKYHFSRIFKQKTGFSFTEYLNNLRIERAKYLMKHEEMNVTEASFAVGFNDLSYFSRLFQKKVGLLPSEYIKRA